MAFARSIYSLVGLMIFISGGTSQASQTESPNACSELLSAISQLSLKTREEELALKRKLELDLEATTSSNQIKHWGDVENTIELEKVMLYLDSGERDKLAAIIKPKHRKIVELIKSLGITAQKLIEDPSSTSLIKEYQGLSVEFGKVYDQYKAHLNLLISVAEGKGIHNLYGKFPVLRGENSTGQVVFDLTSPLAKETAQMTLVVIDLFEGAFYSKSKKPSLRMSENLGIAQKAKNFSNDIRTVFRSNLSTFNGALESRVAAINKRNTLMLRIGKHISYAYLKALSFSRVPDRYKKYAMMIAALSYDRLMLERYLGNIQEVAEITRGVSPEGSLVSVNDSLLTEKQLRFLLDLNASGLDDELLVTFARIPHLKVVWTNLMKLSHDKANESQTFTHTYSKLYERMKQAETEAHQMGDLSYVFEAPLGRHMTSVVVTGSYVFLTSDLMLRWFSDYRIWEVFEWARNGFPLN